MATGVGIDPARIAQLTEREETHLNAETGGSARMYERSRAVMPEGVPSSYQVRDPHPIFLEHGVGLEGLGRRRLRVPRLPQRLRLDGAGPRPPRDRARRHRAHAARHALRRRDRGQRRRRRGARSQRWGLPKWRFTNSGSESTMDAIRLARAHTGPRARGQDGGLLPRPPRRRDGLDRDRHRRRRRGPGRTARSASPTAAASPPHRRDDDPGAVQRRRRARRAPRRARRHRSPA